MRPAPGYILVIANYEEIPRDASVAMCRISPATDDRRGPGKVRVFNAPECSTVFHFAAREGGGQAQ